MGREIDLCGRLCQASQGLIKVCICPKTLLRMKQLYAGLCCSSGGPCALNNCWLHFLWRPFKVLQQKVVNACKRACH